MAKYEPWCEEELNTLRLYYETKTLTELAEMLDRTYEAVKIHCRIIGLSRSNPSIVHPLRDEAYMIRVRRELGGVGYYDNKDLNGFLKKNNMVNENGKN